MKKEITSILCAAAITCSAGAANVSNFSDVRPSDWYHDAVNYVCENGLMNGTSDTAFSPNATTSRGMIVTILYRLAGSPDMPESNWGYPYADVDTNAYYSAPVYWARMNDLVTGYSDTQFGPNDAITREQLTAILYRYADHLGLDTDTGFIPDKYYDFSDYQSVSRYATNAMSWCVNKGIVSGSDGKLNPHGTATRAEVATMLMNAENILDANEPTEPETPVSPDGQPVKEVFRLPENSRQRRKRVRNEPHSCGSFFRLRATPLKQSLSGAVSPCLGCSPCSENTVFRLGFY